MTFSLNFVSFLLTNLPFKFKIEVSSLFPLCSSGKIDQQRKSDIYWETRTYKVLYSAFVLLAGWRFVKIFDNQCTHFPSHKWFHSPGPVCGSVPRLTLKQSLFSSMLSSLFWFLLKMLLLFIYNIVHWQSAGFRTGVLTAHFYVQSWAPVCLCANGAGGEERVSSLRGDRRLCGGAVHRRNPLSVGAEIVTFHDEYLRKMTPSSEKVI